MENSYFLKLIDLLSKNNVSFKIPNRKKIKALVKDEAEERRVKIKEKFAKVDKVAITTDCWTSTKQKIGYMGITVHFYNEFVLHSISLGVKQLSGAHDSTYLATTIGQILTDYEIFHKCVAITGDNASNIKLAAHLLNIPFYGCFAHILNLIVVNTLKTFNSEENDDIDCNEMNSLISKCRKLVGLFNHSTKLNEQLLSEQEPAKKLSLIQDVVTRYVDLYLNKKNYFSEKLHKVKNASSYYTAFQSYFISLKLEREPDAFKQRFQRRRKNSNS